MMPLPGGDPTLRFKQLSSTLVTILKDRFLENKIPKLTVFIYVYKIYLDTHTKKKIIKKK